MISSKSLFADDVEEVSKCFCHVAK